MSCSRVLLERVQRRLIGVHVAVLPVQGDEALLELVEHGACAGAAAGARVGELIVTG